MNKAQEILNQLSEEEVDLKKLSGNLQDLSNKLRKELIGIVKKHGIKHLDVGVPGLKMGTNQNASLSEWIIGQLD